MRLFNAFQVTGIFSGFPFLISWLDGQVFRLAGVAFWAAIVAYVVAFVFMVVSTYDSMRHNGPFGEL